MTKSKLLMVFGTGLAILLAALAFASCAAPAEERMPAVLKVVPDVAPPLQYVVNYYGANFIPGEKVKVVILIDLNPGKTDPLENEVAVGANSIEVDAVGSFKIEKAKAPRYEGVYPVRVYDEENTVIAAGVLQVKKPEEKK